LKIRDFCCCCHNIQHNGIQDNDIQRSTLNMNDPRHTDTQNLECRISLLLR
jgi:hypothetical protein